MKTPIIIACLFLLTNNAFAQNPSGKENIPTSSKDFELEMMKLINDFRKKNNLNELVWNEIKNEYDFWMETKNNIL
jgi:uncharacterized protein YkwD